eukprot:4049921-Pleurochrysis_carterae.AAC.1
MACSARVYYRQLWVRVRGLVFPGARHVHMPLALASFHWCTPGAPSCLRSPPRFSTAGTVTVSAPRAV